MSRYTTLISAADLKVHADQPAWRILDCRFNLMQPAQGRRDYDAGHIPGSQYADLDRDLASVVTPHSGRHPLPDPAVFEATLHQWGISNDSQVVAVDDGSGALAARLWWLMRWLGHDAVAVLDGGLAAWQAAGGTLVRTPSSWPAGRFHGLQRPNQVVSTAEIARRLDSRQPLQLVDARDPDRFAGKVEPIDTVAGHIPGALNFPFAKNIAGDGRWRPPADLRQDWLELLGGEPDDDWAVMCGSGVTACHLALSAAYAGLGEPRLYAGSWSEWIRDPARPVDP
ncbi:MAG: sulfurtransferase [Woeseiaceae bacterium]|nr:sulfurtransferase [Woeseiaceae bacterium]